MTAKNRQKPGYAPFVMFVVLPVAAIGISALAVFRGVENYITTSSYFRIRDVRSSGIRDARYIDLMREEIAGTNIFELDAKKVAERIKKRFPTLSGVRVTRVLPSQLLIEAHERIPVAILKKDQYYLFDAEGVVVSSFALDALVNYPLLSGLEDGSSRIAVGTRYDSRNLQRALRLALALRTGLAGIKVAKIDASEPDNLSLYLEGDVQVKMGAREFEKKLSVLPAILKSIGADLVKVKYIDLRPKEPVVTWRKK